MKKQMMIAAMMIAAMSANAQNEVGQITLQPKVGLNISNITGEGDQKTKAGLVAGFEAEYGVTEKFGVAAGVLYSMEGCKARIGASDGNTVVASEDRAKYNFDYINIPVLAQYYPIHGLAVKAGVQPAFNVRHKYSADGESVTADGVKSFNLSIPVGLSYEYANFVLDARYNIGVTKIFKNTDQGYNSTFSITLGYKIPF